MAWVAIAEKIVVYTMLLFCIVYVISWSLKK